VRKTQTLITAEWMILRIINCFIQEEVTGFQVQLNSQGHSRNIINNCVVYCGHMLIDTLQGQLYSPWASIRYMSGSGMLQVTKVGCTSV